MLGGFKIKMPSFRIHDTLIKEFNDRFQLGLSRYGKSVSTFDGEDYVTHAIEEQEDNLYYMLAVREEYRILRNMNIRLLAVVLFYAQDDVQWDNGEQARQVLEEYVDSGV